MCRREVRCFGLESSVGVVLVRGIGFRLKLLLSSGCVRMTECSRSGAPFDVVILMVVFLVVTGLGGMGLRPMCC